jgi:RHH-type transcriptional regulator, rel operon repressor / antitoxin RelB
MKKPALLSIRVSQDLADRLEKLAQATERSKSYLAAQAIEEFVALQDWQVKAIKDGVAAAEQGELVSHEEALAALGKWGQKRNKRDAA